MAARSNAATVTKARGRALAPDKHSLILDAALSLFRQYGYRRTSMEDIAQSANVAKGTLYIYFKSKDELFEALARRLAGQIDADTQAVMARDLPFEHKVLALLDAKLGFVYRWVLSSPHAAELTDPTSRLPDDVFGPVDRNFRAAFARLFKESARAGEIDLKGAGLTPETAVDTLIAAAHGAEKGARDEADFHERLTRIGRLALRGLRP
ncbi:MAG TPA: helix-turn-helix domain-containing protein [Parvibaculum sp.]|jgi:AcrR family transcriptional regulator